MVAKAADRPWQSKMHAKVPAQLGGGQMQAQKRLSDRQPIPSAGGPAFNLGTYEPGRLIEIQ
jgi:hypothetical protein